MGSEGCNLDMVQMTTRCAVPAARVHFSLPFSIGSYVHIPLRVDTANKSLPDNDEDVGRTHPYVAARLTRDRRPIMTI